MADTKELERRLASWRAARDLIESSTGKKVSGVRDAQRAAELNITKADVAKGVRHDHNHCPVAQNLLRQGAAPSPGGRRGAVVAVAVGKSVVYVVRCAFGAYEGQLDGERYILPHSVAREIWGYDKGASFEPGKYMLYAPQPSLRLGKKQRPKKKRGGSVFKQGSRHYHVSSGVRVSLLDIKRA